MSPQQYFSALLFAGIVLSSAGAQQKTTETPIPSTADFSKEAYVVEHLDSRIRVEQDARARGRSPRKQKFWPMPA